MGTNAEWPTFRRIVVDAFQNAGQVMNVGQEASSLIGILGLVTAGVGITVFCGMPRFCGEHAIAPRPIVTDPPVVIETHLAWRRANTSGPMRRFIETSQKVNRKDDHAALRFRGTAVGALDSRPVTAAPGWMA